MAIKKYLYREDEEVFIKIDKLKNDNNTIVGNRRFSTKEAITFLINRGFEAYLQDRSTPAKEVPKEPNT